MLDPDLSAIGDALCRCYVMRATDVLELEVLRSSSNVNELGKARAREQWRLHREQELFTALHRRSNDQMLWTKLRAVQQNLGLVKDVGEEAAAAVVGANDTSAIESTPMTTLDSSSKSLFDPTSSHAAICSKTAKKPLTTSGGQSVEQLLELVAPVHNTNTSNENASMRSLLLTTSRHFRTFLWLWQRRNTISQTMWEHDIVSVFRNVFELQRSQIADLLSSNQTSGLQNRSAWNDVVQEEEHADRNHARPCWFTWNASTEEKWRQRLPLVLRMQACARRLIVCRRYRPQLVKMRNEKQLMKYQRVQKQLVPTALRYFSQTQGVAHQYVETFYEIAKEQEALEEFFESEEKQFQAQWSDYVKKMTRFFLHECPLDADWIAQTQPDGVTVFVNVNTGRMQTENPNVLKLSAAKNRQWMKATRERDNRKAKAMQMTQHLNALKELLVSLEKKLGTPLYL